MADRLANQVEKTEERLHSNEEERSNAKEGKESRALEEKLGEAGSLSWLLGLGLSLLPSNHLDLSPRWQQWFLRCLTFLSLWRDVQLLSQGPIGSSLDVLFLHHRLYGTHWPLSSDQHCPSEKQ